MATIINPLRRSTLSTESPTTFQIPDVTDKDILLELVTHLVQLMNKLNKDWRESNSTEAWRILGMSTAVKQILNRMGFVVTGSPTDLRFQWVGLDYATQPNDKMYNGNQVTFNPEGCIDLRK